ncbi:MAG TPA: NAD(P)H:quinone oxidoreductase [Flavobacterium sp.]|uniref:NAD(P)H:quinone oxidoreductase n=1 Tax=Empedobacter falsenii TaxID=343874 RepID=A0A7H9DRA9_9FLAO|nr:MULTISPECIES: NAD(P)H:quinone oxidoreductase [Bacteroidota]MBW3524937.1 NAD(P)H:quinone oxidoreductase [Chryseobacterium sp. NKUCC03_KSP]MDV4102907.1 NAD(P)H:quinone oxidoreductase [Elizabethkingia anophelis]OCK52316.1 repressor [Chryseobacterium sp. CBo1]MCT1531781.1 NAD(P)H:quinone oxidoreductase [Sphingobacterium daejeonense]MDM1461401.1 NAD(P)H:quinone oxidoreductase [Myroides odoratimimus]|tara:strand:+ start:1381 stop:2532 length:1152 start_codon:yes stop_codon:yes gene_type:complete
MNKTISFLVFTLSFLLSINTTAMAQNKKTNILVLIHSDNGGTYELAKNITEGIEKNSDANATIKLVKASDNVKLKDIPVANVDELSSYDGIAFGSPVYFGNISTAMSEFLSKTVDVWTKHELEGMPATVFMSAGSGAGKELALQSFWNSLAVHGMILVSNGIRGYENIEKNIPQGNSVLGTTSLASLKDVTRPSKSERYLAKLQGENFAKVSTALKGTFKQKSIETKSAYTVDINEVLKQKNIVLPELPKPVGNYELFSRSGNLVFINQVSLKDGKILYPGKVGIDVTEQQVEEATKVTMLNIIAILKEAVGGDLNKVKKCVQLIGVFNTPETYTQHAMLMNAASDLTVEIFGEKGKHTRNTSGAYSLPVGSSVSIQAIFEVE